jgi:GTP-binding protein LepA
VINKIDLPSAEPQRVAQEIEAVMGYGQEEMILASAKEGIGTREVLEAVVQRIPPPSGRVQARLRALIFDSKYDSYKGVIAYLRVVDGALSTERRLRLMSNQRELDPLEVGIFRPAFAPSERLTTGEVGYHYL